MLSRATYDMSERYAGLNRTLAAYAPNDDFQTRGRRRSRNKRIVIMNQAHLMRVFVRAAKTGSFRRAADRSHVTNLNSRPLSPYNRQLSGRLIPRRGSPAGSDDDIQAERAAGYA